MLNHISAPAPRMILRLFQLKTVLSILKKDNVKPSSIAEIGAGMGDAMSLVLHSTSPVTADLYEDSAVAREILENRFKQNNAISVHSAFTSREKTYQLIVCCEVLEHIEDDEAFIKQIAQSIDEEGWFVGSVPAYMSKWQNGDVLVGHFRRYEKQELIDKLVNNGFSNVSVYTYGFPLLNLLYPIRQLYYSMQLKSANVENKREATAKSGVSRDLAFSFNKSTVYYFVRFFSLFQSLPYFSSFGDGFVFKCQMK